MDAGIAAIPAVPDASETVKGKVELATRLEAIAGTDKSRATTPEGVKATVSAGIAAIPAVPDASETVKGKVQLATTVETKAGTDSAKAITSSGLKGTLAALNTGVAAATTDKAGVVELATTDETSAGTDTVRATTPAGVKATVDSAVSGLSSGTGTTVPDATTSVKGVIKLATQLAIEEGVGADTAVNPRDMKISQNKLPYPTRVYFLDTTVHGDTGGLNYGSEIFRLNAVQN